MRGQKPAFTLAEVLITLAVIGIVAALTIGIFLPKIHSKIRKSQIATAEVKFTKAMEQMALNNAVGPYYDTTQEFVDELQNYLKVSKVCSNDKLEECFGYEKITTQEGKEYEIKDIKSGASDFGMDEDGSDYKETIGIVTIDGTAMLLSWNKNCPILEPKVYPWGGNTNETTGCVAMVMDINLDRSPNMLNKDVALFRAKQLGSECGIEFSYGGKKYCWSAAFIATPITHEECLAHKQIYGFTNCTNNDYWGGTVIKCGGTANMPTPADLAAFASFLYNKDIATTQGTNIYTSSINMSFFNNNPSSGLNYDGFRLWSNDDESCSGVCCRSFFTTYTRYETTDSRTNPWYGVCKIR